MSTTMRVRPLAALALSAALAGSASAQQDLAARVRGAHDGTVRFTFASRPGVCGNGNSISMHDGRNGGTGDASPDVEWDGQCEHGPVRMVLTVRDHEITGMRTYVGGRWRASSDATDLGTVSAPAAASYLLSLARQSAGSVGEKAIFPAALADSVTVWPSLLDIARDEHLARPARRSAVFWLGQFAGDAATKGLTELVGTDTLDRGVRESAVFALSQRPKDEGVPALIDIARTNKDPQIRRRALFWLGQSNDPRALQLFEQLLAGR